MNDIGLLKGDGIGPEIVDAVCRVLDASGANLTYHSYDIGQTSYDKCGELIPNETIEAIKKYKIALKGPITTPIGKGFKSVNVQLRNKFDLYINLRPAFSIKNISKYSNVNLVTVRENSEDLYIGEEYPIEDGYEAIKRITNKNSERITPSGSAASPSPAARFSFPSTVFRRPRPLPTRPVTMQRS